MSNSACYGLIKRPFWGDRLHPFMLALLLSLGSAVVAGWVAKGLIEWGRPGRSHSNQGSKN
ncbi:hypothetical protein [Laspinema olomoucense]|uniref:Uncharacterized protein n=1 Tax=Laspinema olomoucense D3b TaxID=2953688 RepID=A0ABT2N1K4_9CYAN|nr:MULTISPECIES: hypothetical protein [unclassified Laspinema]MCT7972088.1 hypothetical protein [Laspinema sp. D3d]MCT7976567.1 hypothetical protein [Laspinema sp. D3b]MCT7990293.1 hypothetical protein [Laspinema sp. D3a]MCT7994995.1 hypothetical protein [Laspinema sp. D3c]